MFEYKYEDIEDLVRRCRGSTDIEHGIIEGRIEPMPAGNIRDTGLGVAANSSGSSGQSSPSGNPKPSSQQAFEPLLKHPLRPLGSTRSDSPRTQPRTPSIPILSPTSGRHRQLSIEDEHELQSLCHLQAPIPVLDDYGTTPETLYSGTDIGTPESAAHEHGTTTSKDMDEGNEND